MGGAKIKVVDDIGNSQELRKLKMNIFRPGGKGEEGAPFRDGFTGPHNLPEGPDPKPDADEESIYAQKPPMRSSMAWA